MADLVIRSKADVIRFVNSQPVSKSAWLIVLIALGGTFVDAYDFASLGIGVPNLAAEFHLTPFALGSVAAIMGLGALIGGIVGGYYTDKIGRYRMFLLDLICLVVATLGAALSPNLYVLLFFRFLMGIGVGLDYPVAFSFISEFVNTKRKGGSVSLWVFVWQVAVASSVLVALLFYFLGAGPYLWRIAVGFGAVPALIVLLLRGRYMWESPMWAAHNLGLHEAAEIIEKTYGVRAAVVEGPAQRGPRIGQPRVSYKQIFAQRYLSRTVISSIVCITMSSEYFAVGFYLPSISQAIFGKEFIFAAVGTLVSTVIGAIGGLTSAYLVDRIGLRRLVAGGYLTIIVSLVAFWWTAGHTSPYISILLIYLFIIGQTVGPGPQATTISALAYPTNIRGVGTGWAQGMVRLGTIIGFYFFPLLIAALGINRMMLCLTIVPLIGLAAILATSWEPVGQDVDMEESEMQTSPITLATSIVT
jgi:MFS family permease